MMGDQMLPAFIGQLLIEGVDARAIEMAVARVRDLRAGDSITGDDPLRRAFAFEQAERLEQDDRPTVDSARGEPPWPTLLVAEQELPMVFVDRLLGYEQVNVGDELLIRSTYQVQHVGSTGIRGNVVASTIRLARQH